MSIKYRGLFVSKLRKALAELPHSLYDNLFKKKWVVYAKPPFGTPEHIIEYLRRYTHKIAISNYRILSIDKTARTVTFNLKNYRNQGKKTTQTLTVKGFIRRFQNHILPKGFTRIRHYGFLSSSWKPKLPQLQQQLMDRAIETIVVLVAEEKTLHRRCRHRKTGVVRTLLTFDTRGPPKDYKTIAAHKILKYKQ